MTSKEFIDDLIEDVASGHKWIKKTDRNFETVWRGFFILVNITDEFSEMCVFDNQTREMKGLVMNPVRLVAVLQGH
jgi:hypothetical protein